MQIGGGYGLDVSRHFAVRPIDIRYMQAHLPNGNTSMQNDLRFGFGAVYRLASMNEPDVR